jgi:uncharacterized protein involved in response to NO
MFAILKLGLGAWCIVLEWLAIRRISIEAINLWLDERQIEEIVMARSPDYNMAIFSIVLFSLVKYLYPSHRAGSA